ncbi:hypothetical protein KFZ76_07360 [Methylovulum psychrotolerans]|uniref:DUF2846 domain-containing protein n=1 Tax=Methylovulum psychrotolerans TaxID=1704499 RepID=UPI001BFF6969|nr:DUF2846 domain-containing protein [Methylovulum psychrotolerans]MBT9097525.1 hypothetical protein [Methylovulum psychrotolerans]
MKNNRIFMTNEKHKKPSQLLALIILALTATTGCSVSGPAFKPLDPIPANKGVVYIYRAPSFVGGGTYGTVTANSTPITKIKNGGYFPYIANPGPVHFEVSTEATNEADVIVELGKEKYLKTTIGMGFLVGHLKFSEVSSEIGKKEISECNLLEPVEP